MLRSAGADRPVDASSRCRPGPAGSTPSTSCDGVGLGGRGRRDDPAARRGPAGRPSRRRRRSRPTCTACTPTRNGAWAVGAGRDGAVVERHGVGAPGAATPTSRRRCATSTSPATPASPSATTARSSRRRTAGRTGRSQTAPEGAGDLHGVFLVDAQHALGGRRPQGTVLFFDGTAWARQPVSPRVTATLRAVVFTSASEGTAVGDGGDRAGVRRTARGSTSRRASTSTCSRWRRCPAGRCSPPATTSR